MSKDFGERHNILRNHHQNCWCRFAARSQLMKNTHIWNFKIVPQSRVSRRSIRRNMLFVVASVAARLRNAKAKTMKPGRPKDIMDQIRDLGQGLELAWASLPHRFQVSWVCLFCSNIQSMLSLSNWKPINHTGFRQGGVPDEAVPFFVFLLFLFRNQ